MSGPNLSNVDPLPHDAAVTADAGGRTKDGKRNDAAKWLNMLAEARTADDSYHSKCDTIDKLYADLETLADVKSDRQFQIFWANLEVLKPSIYSRPPVPVVTSRFRDRKELPRRTADILERALISDFEADDLHDTLMLVRDDLAMSARGVAWVEMKDRDGLDVPSARHVDRKDFRHGAARKWSEVPWVAKRDFLTRKQFRKRFPDAPTTTVFEKREGQDGKKAEVWELWHKDDEAVVWVAPGAPDVLDEKEPFLNLVGFFPCPRPAYGTLKRATMTPVPDFVYYRDQVEEINEMTARIAALSESLRLRGVYPAGNADVAAAIEAAFARQDNQALLIPVNSMAALGTGSMKDAIVWLPVRDVAEVIVQLLQLRRQLIEDVYEITGISDIMRGSTDAQETLGAQELKSQYGSVRIQDRQAEIIRVARDITRMKAEIMAEEMSIGDLLMMAQVDDLPTNADLAKQAEPIKAQLQQMVQAAQEQMQGLVQMPSQPGPNGEPPADPQQAAQQIEAQVQEAIAPLQAQLKELSETVTQEQVGELLKDQKIRPFVLEIETDSTIRPDEAAEKGKRVEYMGALGPLMQQGIQAMQMAPQLGPFVAESIRFVASAFRAGRQMEDAIDDLAEGFASYQPPAPEGEDPEAGKAAAEAEMAKAQAAQQTAEAKSQEAQASAQATQMAAQSKAQESAAKVAVAQQQVEIDAQSAQIDMQRMMAEMQDATERHRLDMEKIKAEIARIKAQAGAKSDA